MYIKKIEGIPTDEISHLCNMLLASKMLNKKEKYLHKLIRNWMTLRRKYPKYYIKYYKEYENIELKDTYELNILINFIEKMLYSFTYHIQNKKK